MTKKVCVVIDGRSVRVSAGSNLLRTAAQVTRKTAFLCVDQIPCLTECCGLCVVEVEGEAELKRACLHAVERPMTCETYTRRVRRERRRVLADLLSKHHRKCAKCASRRKCALPSLAREYDVTSDDLGIGNCEARGTK